MLVPLFSEIEFFGIKLKKEIEELKQDINFKFGDIKNEIRINQTQTFNATIQGFGPPPPDNKLPELESKIEYLVNQKFKEISVKPEIKIKGRHDKVIAIRVIPVINSMLSITLLNMIDDDKLKVETLDELRSDIKNIDFSIFSLLVITICFFLKL